MSLKVPEVSHSGLMLKELTTYVESTLADLVDLKVKGKPRIPQFRVSSFPYCSVLDALGNRAPLPDEDSTFFQHYVRLGTNVHSFLQELFPHVEHEVFGHWKYGDLPTDVTKEPMYYWQAVKLYPNIKLEYVELEFVYGPLSGHMDLVTRMNKKYKIGWEFKSTGLKYITLPYYYNNYLPYGKHEIQIQTYGGLLTQTHNIKLDAYVIVYFSREKPNLYRKYIRLISNDDLKEWTARVDTAVKGRKRVLKYLADPNKKTFERLVAAKPCTSKATYMDYMHHSFFRDECRFFEDGTCLKNPVKLRKAFKQAVRDLKEQADVEEES